MGVKLCQPSLAILLVSIAGALYHLLAGAGGGLMWWLAVGVVGTATFQALCYGGLESVAWVLMLIPVLLVCFFLAVALFASSMRIQNVEKVPCGRCGHPKPCGCERKPTPPPCGSCSSDRDGCGDSCHKRRERSDCQYCHGGGCPHCLLGSA